MAGLPLRKPKAKAFKLKPPRVAEWPRQTQIAGVLSLELAPPGRLSPDGVVWWANDIAGWIGAAPAARISRGVIAGVPDLTIIHAGKAHFMEVKTPDGQLSEAQCGVLSALLNGGSRIAVVQTAAEAIRALDEWGVPRRRCTAL